MRVAVLLVLGSALAACGRVSFAPEGAAELGDDAAAPAARCGDPSVVPPTLHVTSKTFTYGNSTGAVVEQPNALVAVRARDGSQTYASMKSDAASADFSLDVPTGGHALDAMLQFSRTPDLYTTNVWLDRPLATDLVGPTDVWQPGTGSMWGDAEVSVVYGDSLDGRSHDPSKGTITFEVRDCSGAAIAGAAISVSPAPEWFRYQTDDGSLADANAAVTGGMYAAAVAFNVSAIPTHIVATVPGFAFDPVDIDVSAGMSMDVVVLRGH